LGTPVLHARLTIAKADRLLLAECVKYIENDVQPVVEIQPGSLGSSLLISPRPR
jgi:hypothetical protein